jgi:hypothetical protein
MLSFLLWDQMIVLNYSNLNLKVFSFTSFQQFDQTDHIKQLQERLYKVDPLIKYQPRTKLNQIRFDCNVWLGMKGKSHR